MTFLKASCTKLVYIFHSTFRNQCSLHYMSLFTYSLIVVLLQTQLGLDLTRKRKFQRIIHIFTSFLFFFEMGILSIVAARLVPYGELIRIEKPVGFIYLYASCAPGTLMVECLADSIRPASRLIATNNVLLISSITLRSAACSWNDTVDQEIDRKVTRTRLRPIAPARKGGTHGDSCNEVLVT